MTAAAFQSALARLIVDPAFRDRVRRDGVPAPSRPALSARERGRLRAAAADPGMDVTAMLHRGFRLSKLLGRLPLTFTLLDEATARRELDLFWAAHPPRGFYYVADSIAFCDHLLARAAELRVPFLAEIAAYERAALELQRPRPPGEEPEPQQVRFEHDPVPLLAELAAGRVPESAAPRRCVLVGRRAGDGVEWRLAEPAAGGPPA